MILVFLWILEVALVINCIVLLLRSNFNNLGPFLVMGLTVVLLVYLIWHQQIDTWCSAGFLKAVKVLVLSGLTFYAGLVGFVAISGYAQTVSYQESALIVLGAGLRGETVSDTLKRRLDKAFEYYQKNPQVKIVVTGGKGPGESIAEALAMERYLLQKGVPLANLIKEDKSTSTEENFVFAAKLLAEQGVDVQKEEIAFVTNAFHCYRAKKEAERVGYTKLNSMAASINVAVVASCYMREALAVLYLWVFKH
ncbi:MAG: YdcF family protein [Oscillospiraceae bacterium]|nr:YdcF family protein [Oscillospiraceae bacterium]